MGRGSLPGGTFRVFALRSLLVRGGAAAAEDRRSPSLSNGATSAYASRSAPAAAVEAAAFATESSLASSDAALPIPLNKIVRPFAPLPLTSSAPCPFGLFFGFIRNQFGRCAADGGCLLGRSGKPCTNN